MDDLIKEIQRQLKYAENEYNIINEYIKNKSNVDISDTITRLYWKAQMNAYNNILNYYKQEFL